MYLNSLLKTLFFVMVFLYSSMLFAASTATFYEHNNLKGNKFALQMGKHEKNLPKKKCGRAYERKNWNDRISSIKMGPCTRVRVYQHSNFKGGNYLFENPYSDEDKKITKMPRGWNDQVSSIKTAKSKTCKRKKAYTVEPSKTSVLQVAYFNKIKITPTKASIDVKIKNKSSYFYVVYFPNTNKKKLLGKGEIFRQKFTRGRNVSAQPYYFYVQAHFNLGIYYLQAGYSIVFGDKPPTGKMDAILGLISEKTGQPVSSIMEKDPKFIAEQFIELCSKPKWAKKIAAIAGKKGSEKWIMSKAKNVLSVMAIKSRAEALHYFVRSLRAKNYERIRVEAY